jgi:hypothetical protein
MSTTELSYREFLFSAQEMAIVQATYIEFLQDYTPATKTIFLFYEGPDDKTFYRKFVQIIFDGFKAYYYCMKGKKNVENMWKQFDTSRHPEYSLLFFVDTDYDSLLKSYLPLPANIFTTKYYSIENYCVNEDVLRDILIELYNISEKRLLDAIANEFNKAYSIFSEEITIITSWFLLYREWEQHVDLDLIKMDHLFKFFQLNIRKTNYRKNAVNILKSEISGFEKSLILTEKKLKLLYKMAKVEIELACWKTMLDYLKRIKSYENSKYNLRGKYDLWFMTYFIRNLQTLKDEIIPILSQRNGQNISNLNTLPNPKEFFDDKNALRIIINVLEMPADLRLFLEKQKQKHPLN